MFNEMKNFILFALGFSLCLIFGGLMILGFGIWLEYHNVRGLYFLFAGVIGYSAILICMFKGK